MTAIRSLRGDPMGRSAVRRAFTTTEAQVLGGLRCGGRRQFRPVVDDYRWGRPGTSHGHGGTVLVASGWMRSGQQGLPAPCSRPASGMS